MPDFTADRIQDALGSGYISFRELGGGEMSRVFVRRDGPRTP